jgi:hypothetical protein
MGDYMFRSFLSAGQTALFLCIAMCSSTLALAEGSERAKWLSDWEHERTQDGIRSECREHHSHILQCRFVTQVSVSHEVLSAVIQDVEGFKDWAVSVMVSDRVVFDDADPDTYVYTTYQFTGAYDRDALTRYQTRISDNGRKHRIEFMTVKKDYPARDLRLVRFPLMAGYWQFTQLDNGMTEIEHQSFTPPGGIVQNQLYHLFNIAYVDSSFDTIEALVEHAKQKHFSQSLAKHTE